MKRLLHACAVAVAVWATATTAQDTINVPIDRAGAIATQALIAGDTAFAVQLAEAVLAQNPDDRAALLVVASGAPRLGNPDRGYQAGVRAWRLSEPGTQRYEAARLTALAANAQERFTAATFWLRLALISAPNETARDQTVRDARVVAQRNPWSTQLSFSLAPSKNVNGGSETETSSAPGNPTGTLSEDALRLEGVRGSLGITTSYRFQQNAQSQSRIGISLQSGRVRITEETQVPDESFDTSSARLFLRHDRVVGEGRLSLGLSYGTYTYRDLTDLEEQTTVGESYDVLGASVDYSVPLTESLSLQLGLNRENLAYSQRGIGEVDRLRSTASLAYVTEAGNRVSATYSVTDSDGDSPNYTSVAKSFSTDFRWAEPVFGVTVSNGVGFRWSDYPDYRLIAPVDGGRQDETVFAYLSLGFPEFEFAGFVPGVRFDRTQTDSNVSRFDQSGSTTSFTITSSF